jgi:hypothetical protein
MPAPPNVLRRPMIQRAGWPKMARCLHCNRLRRATSPNDRLCAGCRRAVARIDTGVPPQVAVSEEGA